MNQPTVDDYALRRILAENKWLERRIFYLQAGVSRLRSTEKRIIDKMDYHGAKDEHALRPIYLGGIDEESEEKFDTTIETAMFENVRLHGLQSTWRQRLFLLEARIKVASDIIHEYDSDDSDGNENHGRGYCSYSESDSESDDET